MVSSSDARPDLKSRMLTFSPVVCEYTYKVNPGTLRPSEVTSWHTVDIALQPLVKAYRYPGLVPSAQFSNVFTISVTGVSRQLDVREFKSEAAYNFLVRALAACASLPEGQSQTLKLVVPQSGGYIARSDIIPVRCQRCDGVEFVDSFSEPHQYFPGTAGSMPFFRTLPEIFNQSAGGFLLRRRDVYGPSLDSQLQILDKELLNRLSIPWLLEEKPIRKTIAIVEGGFNPTLRQDSYMTAKALGIDVVVIDKPGHWIEEPAYESWRKAFLPTPIKPIENLSDRIVEAIEKYGKPVDGLITFWDEAMNEVAKAAVRLGLPTNDPFVYEIASDKFKTSQIAGHISARASNLEEAVNLIRITDLKYPVVVKPCTGWSSEGVYKVNSDSELAEALAAVDTERHGKEFVIENYCDGPEVDANFILCDEELVFFEASDEFPKPADEEDDTVTSGFLECGNVNPSELPAKELRVLRNSLYSTLKRIGAKNGLFHLEARMRDSRVEYVTDDGVCDIAPRKDRPEADPSAYLIEINTRPPGVIGVAIATAVYGVDYNASSFCFAIGEMETARALSTPFVTGAQGWGEMLMLPIKVGGLFDSDDIFEELLQRRPDLALHMEKPVCFWKRGDRIPDPSSGYNFWIAGCMVFSKESRRHCIALGEEIRREIKWSIL